MTKSDIFSALCACLYVTVMAFLVGGSLGVSRVQRDAIQHGVGKWTCDADGNKTWVWIKGDVK